MQSLNFSAYKISISNYKLIAYIKYSVPTWRIFSAYQTEIYAHTSAW